MRKVLRFTPKGGRGTLENTSKTRVLCESNVKTRGKCSGSPQREAGHVKKHQQNTSFARKQHKNTRKVLRFTPKGGGAYEKT